MHFNFLTYNKTRTYLQQTSDGLTPYIIGYKPTIFGSILTFKLWGLAYTWVMPHSQSQHDGYQSETLTECVPHTAWTISKSLGLCG